jgi:hypothetical protein
MFAFGVPKALAKRRMKPEASAIAVVEGEDAVKATACGPCRCASPPHRGGGQVQRLVPTDPLPAGVRIALRAGPTQRVSESQRVVDELRRRTSLGADRLSGRVRWIGSRRMKRPASTVATVPQRAMHKGAVAVDATRVAR